MTGSSVAGIITASASVFTAIALVITALVTLLPILRGTRQNAVAIGEVHTLVNQQMTDAKRYNERLMEVLVAHGIPVPRDSSLRAPDGGPAV